MDHTSSSKNNPGLIQWILVVLGFLLVTVATCLVLWNSRVKNPDEDEKAAKVRTEKLAALRKETAAETGGYGWVDQSKGLVRIPVEVAQVKVVELLKAKLVQPGPVIPVIPSATPVVTTTNSAPVSGTPSTEKK